MNKWIIAAALTVPVAVGEPASAQDWAYLGGSPSAEMDMDSILHRNGFVQVHIRILADQPQGRMFMNQILTVDCAGSRARISDGWITSTYSSRIMPMPDLPEHQRTLLIPTPNDAYNVMFNYVCR